MKSIASMRASAPAALTPSANIQFAPTRLCLLAMLPSHDARAAAAELRRMAKPRHRGAQFNIFESGKPPFDP
jgi:hypothetical protein